MNSPKNNLKEPTTGQWVSSSTPSSLAKSEICQLEWSNRPSTRDKNRPWERTSALDEDIQNSVHLHKTDISCKR